MARAPFMKFFPADWLQSAELRTSSLAARGLWIELLCHMHQAKPRGYLLIGGKPPSVAAIAVLCGVPESIAKDLLDELESRGVSDKIDGVIINRRMVREGEISSIRQASGSKGASKREAKRKQTRKQNSSKSDSDCASKGSCKPLDSRFYDSGFSVAESNRSAATTTLPEALDFPQFREAWEMFLEHRRSIKKPLRPLAIENQLKVLVDWVGRYGIEEVCRSIQATVANQWQGLFEPKPRQKPRQGATLAETGFFDGIIEAVRQSEADNGTA